MHFLPEPALAPPGECPALFSAPLGLPEDIWSFLSNIWTLRGEYMAVDVEDMEGNDRVYKIDGKQPN